MTRTHLSVDRYRELSAYGRKQVDRKVSDRVWMVLLYDQDWSPARIGRELGYCAHTVRRVLKGYQARGQAVLHPGRAGRPPDLARRQQVESALRELLPQRRSWTSRQLSEALAAFGIRIKPRQVCAYLRRLRSAAVQSPASTSTASAPAAVNPVHAG